MQVIRVSFSVSVLTLYSGGDGGGSFQRRHVSSTQYTWSKGSIWESSLDSHDKYFLNDRVDCPK